MNKQLKTFLKRVLPQSLIREIREYNAKRIANIIIETEIKPYQKDSYTFGINLIGSFSQDSGLGQSCRLLAKAIEKTNIPLNYINYRPITDIPKTNFEFEDKYSNEYKYAINIFHINALEMSDAFKKLKRDKFDGHYNIAFWLWEMQEFPNRRAHLINIFDEIWTPSEFVSQAIRKKTNKPVKTIPYIIEAPYNEEYDRKHFNLPEDKFLFLMMYDFNSVQERKNPNAVIDAFKKAFNNNENVGLIIKVGNSNKQIIENLKNKLIGYNAYILEGTKPKEEINSLIKCSDVYVSLHRSEGYGLVLAEAMKLGIPTIATNYSSNIEFQNNDTSCLVSYNLIPLEKELFPYEIGSLWADANIEEASNYMKKLYEDKKFYNNIKDNAYNYMNNEDRIKEICELIEKEYERIKISTQL